jgi:enamine deaminase RidA (YjgF/YER057c/UK114 family)
MNTNPKMAIGEGSRPVSAEQRLKELGIKLPAPPEPFGAYAEAVQTGNLLFLTGMLPTEGREAKFIGRVGAELDVETGRKAANLAALNALAVAREHLGSLDKVTRIVRLGVSVALRETSASCRNLLTALRSCCKTCSEKTRTLAGWCMAWQAFRLEHRSNWKSFSRWGRGGAQRCAGGRSDFRSSSMGGNLQEDSWQRQEWRSHQ